MAGHGIPPHPQLIQLDVERIESELLVLDRFCGVYHLDVERIESVCDPAYECEGP